MAVNRTLPALIAVTLAIGAGARAQEAIPTAANAADSGAPVVDNTGGPIILSNKRVHDDRGPIRISPCGGVSVSTDGSVPPPDRSPHGSVWGGVGTHGYRNIGGVVCIPVGDHSRVTLAVDSTQWGRR
jgi:hypothetical protein